MKVISREFIQQAKNDEIISKLKKELDFYKTKCFHWENYHSPNVNIDSTGEIKNKSSIYMNEVEELKKKNLQFELSCEAVVNERERNENFVKNANKEKNYLLSEISKLRELLLLRYKIKYSFKIIIELQCLHLFIRIVKK